MGTRLKSAKAGKLIAEKFPAAFSQAPPRPLKIGLAADLLAHGIDRQAVREGLRWYCGSHRYLVALQEGTVRIGLDGEPAGVVTADEAAHAQQRLAEWLKPKPIPPQPERAARPKQQPKASPKVPPKASPKPPPETPAKAKSEPFGKGRNAGNKAVVVEVRRKPAWKHGSGPKRTFNV